MSKLADPKLALYWRDLIKCQQSSGLSIPQFCLKVGVHNSRFYIWRRRFELIDAPESRSTPPAPSAFLPVSVRAIDTAGQQPFSIEADFPNGVRVRIPTADACLASRLIRTIAAASTNSGDQE